MIRVWKIAVASMPRSDLVSVGAAPEDASSLRPLHQHDVAPASSDAPQEATLLGAIPLLISDLRRALLGAFGLHRFHHALAAVLTETRNHARLSRHANP